MSAESQYRFTLGTLIVLVVTVAGGVLWLTQAIFVGG